MDDVGMGDASSARHDSAQHASTQHASARHGGAGASIYAHDLGWHVAFAVMLALSAVTALAEPLRVGERVTYLSMLAVLGVAYALLGMPATRERDRVRSHAYRLVLCLVVGVIASLAPEAMLILFIAFPQVWFLSERNIEGVVFSVLVIASVTTGMLSATGWSVDAFVGLLPLIAISLGTSLVLGLWIAKVIDQSQGRAELVAELEAARDELAIAHHASGVVAERERIAREIHDTLAQGFTSIVMLAETASTHMSRNRADLAAGQLAQIEDTARDNLAEARALVAAFSPAALSQGTLADAIRRLASRFTAETGVLIEVRLDPDEEAIAALHAGQQVVLLRAAQEALTNVRKHSGARRVHVVLSAPAGEPATIEVRDDGAGFEPTVLPHAGFGLAGMRGRVEEAGGTVQVDSEPGRGTRVRVRVPVAAAPGGS